MKWSKFPKSMVSMLKPNQLKRTLDVLLSFTGLLFFGPLFFFLALLIKLESKGPVLFKQPRPGIDGHIFTLYKFRTMRDIRDEDNHLLPDIKRLTGFGSFLRRTSLDELPELWNVLVGEMSLVGPRPLLVEYLDKYSTEQFKRHHVKPGITGWAQVNGRNALTWEQKFQLDVWYVEHWSLGLDLNILIETLRKIFLMEGINFSGSETINKFEGSR